MRYLVVEGDFTPYFKFAVQDTKRNQLVGYFNKRETAERTAKSLNK